MHAVIPGGSLISKSIFRLNSVKITPFISLLYHKELHIKLLDNSPLSVINLWICFLANNIFNQFHNIGQYRK